jgi:hypothetical protein
MSTLPSASVNASARVSASASASVSVNASVSASVRGARTHACSVHTRVNASSPPLMRTGPNIFLSLANHPSLHRVILYIRQNPLPLPIVSNPMVVRFPLPERLTRSPKYKVRPSGGNAFERLQQQARSHHRQQQHMHMVRHDGKCPEMVLAQFNPFEQRSNHQLGDSVLSQEYRTGSRAIHISVHPNKCLPARELIGRRISPMGKAPVQIPSKEEPLVFRIDVGQPAGRLHYSGSASYPIKISLNLVGGPPATVASAHGASTHGESTRGASTRGARTRGARTRACSVHTRVNASSPFAPVPPSIPQRKCAPTPLISTNPLANISRSHECERCTQECVRHGNLT